MRRLLAFVLLWLSAGGVGAANLFVDGASGDDARAGANWALSKRTIQSALLMASSTTEADVISVAEGVYRERVTVPPGVTLLGGFPSGGGPRDISLNRTVLDGDYGGTVVSLGPGTDDCVLDGLTIRRGRNMAADQGGGLTLTRTSARVRDCIIESCLANKGGGVFVTLGEPIFERCAFRKNQAANTGGGAYVLSAHDAPTCARFRGCLFELNRCGVGDVGGHGAAAHFRSHPGGNEVRLTDPVPVMDVCIIRRNAGIPDPYEFAADAPNPAALDLWWGGRTATIRNTIFRDNADAAAHVLTSEVVAQIRFENCEFSGHVHEALSSVCRKGSRLTNCTFADNGAAVLVQSRLSTNLTLHELRRSVVAHAARGTPDWSCTPIEVTLIDSIAVGGHDTGTNIVDADPLFVRGPHGEYFLSQVAAGQATDSPALDQGPEAAADLGLGGLTTRLDGAPDAGLVDWGVHYGFLPDSEWPEPDVPLDMLEVVRGSHPLELERVALIAALPYTGERGLLSDPLRTLLFYRVQWASSPIRLSKDAVNDTVVVGF